MTVYKRTLFNLIKSILMAPCAAVMAGIVINIFIHNPAVYATAAFLIFAALLYMALFSENIYFEIDDQGVFRYYKRNKLEEEYTLAECRIGYHRKSDRVSSDIILAIYEKDEEHNIDCSPIGVSQFEEMFAHMEGFTQSHTELLTASKE